MLGCSGAHKANRLAEIIAGFCLALDLSTMSALVNGTFAKAHERLGRNRPVDFFKSTDLGIHFLTEVMKEKSGNASLKVDAVRVTNNFNATDSIITELTARNQEKFIGIFPYQIEYRDASSEIPRRIEVIIKSKPIDAEVIMLGNKMAGMCNSTLGDQYERFKGRSESLQCHLKELAIYRQTDPSFTKHVPHIHGIYEEEKSEAYIVVMERLENMLLLGSPEKPEQWQQSYIEAAICGMAQLHSLWYRKERQLCKMPWIGFIHDAVSMSEQKTLFREMVRHASLEFPTLVTKEMMIRNYDLIENLGEWWAEMDQMDKTLIHNDFNPRNVGLRSAGEKPLLCAFDWELATLQIPQHDLAEFLSFVTTSDTSSHELDGYIELHRQELTKASGFAIDKVAWRRGYELSLYDLAINRIAMYLMAHTFKHYPFMDHLFKNNSRLIDIERRNVSV